MILPSRNGLGMLKKFAFCLVLIGAPQAAAAQSVQDQIVTQLRAQGFTEIALNRTWLGRVRVIAVRDDLRRELVFNPQTGEILRDYWVDADDAGPRILNPGGGSDDDAGGRRGNGGYSGSSGNDDDEDDDEDDGNDDDEDEDDDE